MNMCNIDTRPQTVQTINIETNTQIQGNSRIYIPVDNEPWYNNIIVSFRIRTKVKTRFKNTVHF